MREVSKLGKMLSFTLKSFLIVSLVMTFLTSTSKAVATGNLIDAFIDGNAEFFSGEYIDRQSFITGNARLAPEGNIFSSLYGGQLNNLDFQDGCITLTRDLTLTGSFIYSGSVSGTITADYTGDKTIFFSKDQTLSNHVTFTGQSVVLDGDGQTIDFDSAGTFSVGKRVAGKNSTLTLRNLILENLPTSWMWLENGANQVETFAQTSSVSFDRVVFESDPYSDNMVGDRRLLAFKGDCNQFNAGFKLPGNVALGTKYPISGALDLNVQALTLNSDLNFEGDGSLADESGTLLADADGNNRTLFFNADQTFNHLLSVSSSMILDGNQYALDLNSTGSLGIGNGKTLRLKNWSLENLKSNWVIPAAGTLAFDNVVFESDPYSSGITDGDGMTFTNNCRFEKGFTLPVDTNLETTEPFSGPLDLNSGTLTLYSDLHFSGEGSIVGSDGTIAADNDYVNRTLFFNADQTFDNATLTFNNSVVVDCDDHQFDLDLGGKFVVANGKTLSLRNMTIKNPPSDWLTFNDADARLSLEDVKLIGPHNLTINELEQVYGQFDMIY
jgi:hypothetical protein